MNKETVFFCLTFDVEPDIGRIGGGMRGIEKGVFALLNIFNNVELNTSRRLVATWFITHDNWCKVAELHHRTVENIANRGDEIALHVHFGKQKRYFFDEGFQRKLLEEGTDSLRASGYVVTSFRGGGLHFDGNTLRILEELGYLADSSVLPGLRGIKPGGFWVDHTACIMSEPYYMNRTNYCLPGDSDLMECPISTTKFFKFFFPPYFVKNSLFRLQLKSNFRRMTGLGHAMRKPDESLGIVRQLLSKKPRRPPPIIVLGFHPWEFFEASPKVNRIPSLYLKNIEEWLTKIAQNCGVEFSTLRKACEVWRENNPRKEPVNQKLLLTLSPSSFGMKMYRRRVDV